ncbi:MAG TPA: VOC family protein [Candidatus Dormibacteraeota bacterium]|nr:VOC family protein [Candidatus Dormibacteraeota bacterium]
MLKIKSSAPAIPAQDVKRARQFYEQKLGLKPAEEQADGGARYVTGETGFLVFQSMGKASGEHTQMAFEVEDVAAAVRDLKSNGVKLEEYDYPEFKTHDGIVDMPDGSKGAWFKDTEGNLIAINSRVPSATRRS